MRFWSLEEWLGRVEDRRPKMLEELQVVLSPSTNARPAFDLIFCVKAIEFEPLVASEYPKMQGHRIRHKDSRSRLSAKEEMKNLWDLCGEHLIRQVVVWPFQGQSNKSCHLGRSTTKPVMMKTKLIWPTFPTSTWSSSKVFSTPMATEKAVFPNLVFARV